ncbi:MAG: hypothetical protein JWL71_2765 [Acidobacteria bacterium]|nr:hypothetical protein [Acidobacteriota bacterium]
MTRSLDQLRAKGITFTPDEAVAITQKLIEGLRHQRDAAAVRPPYGPPSTENVWLTDEGTVICRGCTATPAVSEVGIFLESLLPQSLRVPGALRYTIARALLDVDVPPFDSLDDLSRDLARHERGTRAEVVRGVLTRADRTGSSTLALVDRRKARGSTSELRRALREADARLFEQHRQAQVAPIDVAPVRRQPIGSVAACVAAGLALICTGEFMHRRHAPVVVPQAVPVAAQAISPEPPRLEPARLIDSAPPAGAVRGIIAVHDVRSVPSRPPRAAARQVSAKRTSARPSTDAVHRQAPSRSIEQHDGRRPSKGVLDRLRLGWLRGAFAVHSDM